MSNFNYTEAFSRNTGWVTAKEQLILKNKTVAIAGMGGVGGFHLLTLCRLGIETFHISDPDQFELVNFNRQAGATISSLGQSKCHTLIKMAKDINPNVKIELFDEVNPGNVHEFLKSTDLYIDGVDFFAIEARELLFKTCEELKIPAITAAPIGMGVNYLIFNEHGMTFDEYFKIKDKTRDQKLIQFMIGLTPKPVHLRYLVEKSAVDFANGKGPSTVMSCMLCSGVIGVVALKILLNRGKVYPAPHFHQFDPYANKYKKGYLLWGNNNPIQLIKRAIITKFLKNTKKDVAPAKTEREYTDIEQIINLARWAPSGDNTQPWRFKITSDKTFLILIENPIKEDIYNFDNIPTLISTGCLMESIILASRKLNFDVEWKLTDGSPDTIEVKLIKSKNHVDDHQLSDFLMHRSVDRNPYQKKALPSNLANTLDDILDDGYQFKLITDKKAMNQLIQMNMLCTQIRLVLEKAHKTHQKIIQWDKSKTDFGIPYSTLGLSKATVSFMKLFFNHWNLVYFLNYYFGGSKLLSLELDYLPGKHSAGFFTIEANKSIDSMSYEDRIDAGMQIQRAWLYLTKLNLSIQPCFAPLMFSYYERNKTLITENPKIAEKIKRLTDHFKMLGFSDKTLFIARIGYPQCVNKTIRSTRLSLDDLIIKK
jgi:sulfur-carrier protein adenylyltransferase/sulfurtransferase